MSANAEMALAALQEEQTTLQKRIQTLEEERRLFEKLGYSHYYLDMQLRELRAELALCQVRIRHLGRSANQPFTIRRIARQAPDGQQDDMRRYFAPVLSAFLVSLLALGAAGLLWYQRFAPQAAPTPTVPAIIVATPQPTPTVMVPVVPPSPQVAEAYAAVTTEGLNVRRDAGTGAPVLGILSRGAVVVLSGDQEDVEGSLWYRLNTGGWVMAEYLRVFPSKEEAEVAAEELRTQR
jgi:hypothetical protein